jgi:methyltransferase (TIGR00027 family)
MKGEKPSWTAELAAALRTAEWLAPENKRTCNDPYAKEFLGPIFGTIAKSRLLTRIAIWFSERIAPGMVGYIAGRVRYVDDYLEARVDDGIEQLVILGAGYDSRAYRFDGLRGKGKVFEVDYPATQRVKIEKVKRIFGSLPEHVVYVPIDFENQKLDDRLFESGYDRNLKTLFIWEGVTYYITPEGVDTTLAFVANNSGEGSSIIFDYVFQSVIDGTCGVAAVNRARKVYELLGTPLTSEHPRFGVEEGTIEEFLTQRGFHQVENITGDHFESAHVKGANQNKKLWCVVYASVAPCKQT